MVEPSHLIREEQTDSAWKMCLGLWRDLLWITLVMRMQPKTTPTSMEGVETASMILSSSCQQIIVLIIVFYPDSRISSHLGVHLRSDQLAAGSKREERRRLHSYPE